MNSVNLIGRLADNPKLYAYGTNGDHIVFITLAVSRNYKNSKGEVEADFIKCQAFNERAERISKHCKKGNRVGIVGRVKVKKSYNSVTNHNEYEQVIEINQVMFLESKTNIKQQTTQVDQQEEQTGQQIDDFTEFGREVVINDDDLPFATDV